MTELVDWCCDLLSCMRIDLDGATKEPIEAMQHLHNTYGISRFCLMPLLDATIDPANLFLVKRAVYERMLRKELPGELAISFSARVLLRPELIGVQDLEKLSVATNGYLPIALPICEYDDWIDLALNRLLYKRKCKLLFTACEQYPILYPPDAVEKIFRIPDAIYQFGLNALAQPQTRRLIYNLIKKKRSVLFGTSINCLHAAWNLDLRYYESSARELIPDAELNKVFCFGLDFWNRCSS